MTSPTPATCTCPRHLGPGLRACSGTGSGQHGATPQIDLLPGAQTRLGGTVSGVWPFDVVTTSVTVTADGGVQHG